MDDLVYENIDTFYFITGRLGHNCDEIKRIIKEGNVTNIVTPKIIKNEIYLDDILWLIKISNYNIFVITQLIDLWSFSNYSNCKFELTRINDLISSLKDNVNYNELGLSVSNMNVLVLHSHQLKLILISLLNNGADIKIMYENATLSVKVQLDIIILNQI